MSLPATERGEETGARDIAQTLRDVNTAITATGPCRDRGVARPGTAIALTC